MIPIDEKYEETKALCDMLTLCGILTNFDTTTSEYNNHIRYPKIWLFSNDKLYHFSDPDWDVVNKQLFTLLQKFSVNSP